MRDGQHFRRLLYFAFGVVPAVIIVGSGGVKLMPGNFSWMTLGAEVGTAGLCAAAIAHVPPASLVVRVSIASALIAGMLTMSPWTLMIIMAAIQDVANGHAAAETNTMHGALDFLWTTAEAFWWFVGPVIVAAHFLVSLVPRDPRPVPDKA